MLAGIGQDVTPKRFERSEAHTVELRPVTTNPEHEAIEMGAGTDDAEIGRIMVGAIVGTRSGVE